MPQFSYQAINTRGEEKSGELEAASAESAMAALKAEGLYPTALNTVLARERASAPSRGTGTRTTAVKSATHANVARENSDVAGQTAPAAARRGLLDREIRLPFVRTVSAQERAVFTRQLGTLLKAGMPLLRGLEVVARQERNRSFRRGIESLAEEIRSGGTLSDGMTRQPAVFEPLFVNMVKAGEAGGVLEVVLDRLARFEEKSLQLRGKVKAAMVYPVIVMTVAVLILAGLLVFVVPKFQQIFADLLKGAPLPVLTQMVLAVSEFVRAHFLIALGAAVAGMLVFRWFRRTVGGARMVDGALLRMPVFGDLVLKSLVARFSRTLGTLLSSGVPILQAITVTRDTTGNARLAEALDAVHDAVKQGESVAAPLQAAEVFPGMVTSLIDVGEHTGQLPEMLNKVADIYDEEVDTAVAGLSSMIEPMLIVFLAAVVGTIVIALFLPIVRIVQLLT
jgi:type IV pilus assembly protein PilC